MEEEQDWQAEAKAVIQDVQPHVKKIEVATLTPSGCGIVLNLTTIEDQNFSVLLSPAGFSVIGNEHNSDSQKNRNERAYESQYALLIALSPLYQMSFGNLLREKLTKLSKETGGTQ